MQSLMKVAIVILLFSIITITAPAHARCKVGRPEVTNTAAGACAVRTVKVKVEDPRAPVAVTAQELTCGKLRLGSWEKLAADAAQACQDNQESEPTMEFYMGQSFTVVATTGSLVSVDTEAGYYTGGAHPGSSVKRRTYSMISGEELSLEQAFPGRAPALLATAQKRFKKLNKEEGFGWDPRAFSVKQEARGVSIVEFALPHQVEVMAGQTLKLKLEVKGSPKEPATGKK